jgi:pimeloyl-ACP methyl ester carboxylesterase
VNENWRTASVDGIQLAYQAHGDGEPVLLIHAGVVADWFAPLLDEPALASRYRLLTYHRVNYGRSSHLAGPVSIAEQAAHARALLDQLGITRAHVVGHSAGAAIALQLTMDTPAVVQSLTVMDAAISTPLTPPPDVAALNAPGLPAGPPFIVRALEQYAAGDRASAVDMFMRGVCGPGYRASLEAVLPSFFVQAVADADGLFQSELPALRVWQPTPEQLGQIAQPTLAVAGAESPPVFAERQRRLLEWLPRAEAYTLPGAGHLLQVEQPSLLAVALADFLSRHLLSVRQL